MVKTGYIYYMKMTLQLKAGELNESVIEAIRLIFKDSERLVITVSTDGVDEQESGSENGEALQGAGNSV